MLTTIVLGGHLGQKFGRVRRLHLESQTPAEAVSALKATVPGFAAYLTENSRPGYHVFVGKRDVGEFDLDKCRGKNITIMPALVGAGGDNGLRIFQIVLGAVLIAAGAVLAITGYGTAIAPTLIGFGASLVVGGVSQMLFAPPPRQNPPERPENQPNYAFNGPVNTMAQGWPVPICYGELEVGSQVISAGLEYTWTATGGFAGNRQKGPGGVPPSGDRTSVNP